MKEMSRLISIASKAINVTVIILINFLILGWDTRSEFYWKFNLRIFKEFVMNYDFYSYFYICTLIFLGEIILFLNLFFNYKRFNKNLNVFGLLLIMIGLGWLLSLGFGTPELNYYHVLSIFCLIIIFFVYSRFSKSSKE